MEFNLKARDVSGIRHILTFRYNPNFKTLLPKLHSVDFVKKELRVDPAEFIDNSITETISKKIKRLRKVSASLSSGIDSTLICTILRKNFPNLSINTISVVFSNSYDESPAAKKIADKLETNHNVLKIDNFLEELPAAINVIKWPFWDMHWYYVARKAKSLSSILLSGDGGDELFGGYTFRYEKFLSLANSKSSPCERARAYLRCHERDWVPDQDRIFSKKMDFSWENMEKSLVPHFNNKLDPLSQVFLADYNGKLLYNWSPVYRAIHRYFSIDYLAPLLEKNLIKFATHLPNKMKYDEKTGVGKIILRQILEKYDMHDLIIKRKQGFSVDTKNYWKAYGHEICRYYLTESRITRDGWIDGEWISKYLDKRDLDVRYVNKLLGLLAFEIWYRLFVTKEISSTERLTI